MSVYRAFGHHKIGGQQGCGKVAYASAGAAREAAFGKLRGKASRSKNAGSGKPTAYFCESCGGFHWGHWDGKRGWR